MSELQETLFGFMLSTAILSSVQSSGNRPIPLFQRFLKIVKGIFGASPLTGVRGRAPAEPRQSPAYPYIKANSLPDGRLFVFYCLSKTFFASVHMLKLGFVYSANAAGQGQQLFADDIDDTVSLREEVLLKLKGGSYPVA